MDWAVSKGVMKGKGNNILDPQGKITRAEGAQMLKNFFAPDSKQQTSPFFGTSKDNSSHTGIVEEVDDTYVYTIEGNTSDQVARRKYKLSDKSILGYGRPAF